MKSNIIMVSMIISSCALNNASIGDVIGGAIDSSIGVVHDAAHSVRDRVHRDHPHLILIPGANEAFAQRYDAALEQIRELESKDVSSDQKKQNISRLITLSNEIVDSLASELPADQVQNLRTYVSKQVKRMRELQNTNDFNGAANVADDLFDNLSSFE